MLTKRDFPTRFHAPQTNDKPRGIFWFCGSCTQSEAAAADGIQTSHWGLKSGQKFLEKGNWREWFLLYVNYQFSTIFLLSWPLLGILWRRQASLRTSVPHYWIQQLGMRPRVQTKPFLTGCQGRRREVFALYRLLHCSGTSMVSVHVFWTELTHF